MPVVELVVVRIFKADSRQLEGHDVTVMGFDYLFRDMAGIRDMKGGAFIVVRSL